VKLLEILSAVLESSDKISKLKKANSDSVSFDFDEVLRKFLINEDKSSPLNVNLNLRVPVRGKDTFLKILEKEGHFHKKDGIVELNPTFLRFYSESSNISQNSELAEIPKSFNFGKFSKDFKNSPEYKKNLNILNKRIDENVDVQEAFLQAGKFSIGEKRKSVSFIGKKNYRIAKERISLVFSKNSKVSNCESKIFLNRKEAKRKVNSLKEKLNHSKGKNVSYGEREEKLKFNVNLHFEFPDVQESINFYSRVYGKESIKQSILGDFPLKNKERNKGFFLSLGRLELLKKEGKTPLYTQTTELLKSKVTEGNQLEWTKKFFDYQLKGQFRSSLSLSINGNKGVKSKIQKINQNCNNLVAGNTKLEKLFTDDMLKFLQKERDSFFLLGKGEELDIQGLQQSGNGDKKGKLYFITEEKPLKAKPILRKSFRFNLKTPFRGGIREKVRNLAERNSKKNRDLEKLTSSHHPSEFHISKDGNLESLSLAPSHFEEKVFSFEFKDKSISHGDNSVNKVNNFTFNGGSQIEIDSKSSDLTFNEGHNLSGFEKDNSLGRQNIQNQNAVKFSLNYNTENLNLYMTLNGKTINLRLLTNFSISPTLSAEISSIIKESGFIPGKILFKSKNLKYSPQVDRKRGVELKI